MSWTVILKSPPFHITFYSRDFCVRFSSFAASENPSSHSFSPTFNNFKWLKMSPYYFFGYESLHGITLKCFSSSFFHILVTILLFLTEFSFNPIFIWRAVAGAMQHKSINFIIITISEGVHTLHIRQHETSRSDMCSICANRSTSVLHEIRLNETNIHVYWMGCALALN